MRHTNAFIRRLTQSGFDHVLLPLMCFVVFALIGSFYLYHSLAATSVQWKGVLELSRLNSGYCLTTTGSTKASLVELDPCSKTYDSKQVWDIVDIRQATVSTETDVQEFYIQSADGGECIDDWGASKVSSYPEKLYPCSTTDSALTWLWGAKFTSRGYSAHQLSNLATASLCLDDRNDATTSGTYVGLYTCKTSAQANQEWIEQGAPGSSGSGSGSGSSCGPSGQCVPTGNITGWNQVFETNFPGTVPLGAFSGCTTDSDGTEASAYCTGLKSYSTYYDDWWAYPSGWPDTAEECIEGNSACPNPGQSIPIGGDYEPQESVSVSGNEMHIHMYRPSSGNNVVATVIPRSCMNMKYGRYTERFEVTGDTTGFKSAHLFYQGGFEIDYPENDYGSTISAYTHPGGANFSTNAKWTTWHTTVIQWTASSVQFYMDGNLIGTTSTDVPNIPMSWILQNESSILGPYASVGASTQLNIAWVACYSQS